MNYMPKITPKKKLNWHRFCKRCGEKFISTGKYHRICEKCGSGIKYQASRKKKKETIFQKVQTRLSKRTEMQKP